MIDSHFEMFYHKVLPKILLQNFKFYVQSDPALTDQGKEGSVKAGLSVIFAVVYINPKSVSTKNSRM